jgi:DNA-binding NtrC family response regulator
MVQHPLRGSAEVLEREGLVGVHPAIVDLRDRIKRVARRNASVMITGESGVGKELVAREVHMRSPRSAGPFVVVNCGGLSESLLASELFGHERGAFTGATARRIGLFERAHGGTLFLDEIGDASLTTQVRLLRVLEDGRFERLGGVRTLTVDVRIVAAANQDLSDLCARARFREDLLHRLNVFPIRVVPLRKRASDIPLLIEVLSKREGFDLVWMEAALERVQAHPWPGNVRELLNVLERLTILCEGEGPVTVEWVEQALDGCAARIPTVQTRLAHDERERLTELLIEHRFNVSALARRLGLSRGARRHRLRKYGLR